ncbi:MAG: HAD family phosphatase [Pseudomonadota bacterium]
MTSSPFSAYIFDLGGVLFNDGNRIGTARIADALGLPVERVHGVLSGVHRKGYRRGEITESEFWRTALSEWNSSTQVDAIAPLWHESYEIRESMRKLLLGLRERGARLVFLSDNTPERARHLSATTGFTELFDAGVYSFEVGETKPALTLYKKALRHAGCNPSDCLYVDDKSRLLMPAIQLGIRTLHFRNVTTFFADLTALGVLPTDGASPAR